MKSCNSYLFTCFSLTSVAYGKFFYVLACTTRVLCLSIFISCTYKIYGIPYYRIYNFGNISCFSFLSISVHSRQRCPKVNKVLLPAISHRSRKSLNSCLAWTFLIVRSCSVLGFFHHMIFNVRFTFPRGKMAFWKTTVHSSWKPENLQNICSR